MEEQINWEILLNQLAAGKCVLCIGPDIYSEGSDSRLEKKLADTLRQKASVLGIRVYEDGWFHYLEKHDELATWFTIKKFYEKNLPAIADNIFRQLTDLPFSLILNFSPDYKLKQIFESAGRAVRFVSLSKNPESNINQDKDKGEEIANRPFIYNILGELEVKDSLVMTYDDLYNYLEAVFEHKRLSPEVKLKIQNATYFIFLGMPLDKWYFHLFMRILNQHKDKSRSKRYSASTFFDASNATFCEEQYTLSCVQQGLGFFVDLLCKKWQEAKAQKEGKTALSIFDRWREYLKTPESNVIFTVLREMREQPEITNELTNSFIMLEAQWNVFLITPFETEMAKNAVRNQIINGILSSIDLLERSAAKPVSEP